jgi:hypothetical protein
MGYPVFRINLAENDLNLPPRSSTQVCGRAKMFDGSPATGDFTTAVSTVVDDLDIRRRWLTI